ncbi:hypothetical protein [Secundilactobacillus malefermentans]|uniref:Uncharacterized protein n=1 Tax=Secundilactobacillus malefermentans TaxID=176292 RepID=A0A4V3A4B4_9LACO|nr:hypothetical protein [Secundilactobacillus malefermentans]KRM58078.1 hypothetical protein FD44_GL000817 [Secundilactobacillus malefermentans DSM 5705 = KCTC 3548]QEA31361.1 hypothetical protein FGL90_03760 [Secundilactobacillus malefermentans]TDG80183.1 hypothetical protein C5L31_001793 [Secundilactobacillus malefermentans]
MGKINRFLLGIGIALLAMFSLEISSVDSAKAATWHKNVLPKTIKGKWHNKTNTFVIGRHSYMTRISGWNTYSKTVKFRFPYHGLHNFKYKTTSKHHYYVVGKFDPNYEKVPLKIKKISKNKLGINAGYYEHGKAHFQSKWSYLYRGAR